MTIKGRRKRELPAGRYITLREYMLLSPAWRSLDCNSRCLYMELALRWKGPDSNNGKIPFSVREAAAALNIGRSTANRCFDQLQDRGFVRIGKLSGFNMKGRVSTEWLLTEFADDTKANSIPTKDFMKWLPPTPGAVSFNSPTSDAISPTSEPHLELSRDRVAIGQR